MERQNVAYGTLKWLYDNDQGSFIYLDNLKRYWSLNDITDDLGADLLNYLATGYYVELFQPNYNGKLPKQVKITYRGIKEVEYNEQYVVTDEIMRDIAAEVVKDLENANFDEDVERLDENLTKLETVVLSKDENVDDRLKKLELISKEREVKYYYPFMIANVIVGILAFLSILSDIGYINLNKNKQPETINIKDTTYILFQNKMGDSTYSVEFSIPDSLRGKPKNKTK